MKKLSSVFEKDMNEQDVIFASPVEAKRYTKLLRWAEYEENPNLKKHFDIKDVQLYSSVKDYANNHKEEYILKLVKARKNITEYMNSLKQGKIYFKVEVGQYFFVSNLPSLLEITPENISEKEVKLVNYIDKEDSFTQILTEDQYPFIKASVNKIHDQIMELKSLDRQYKNELNSLLDEEQLTK